MVKNETLGGFMSIPVDTPPTTSLSPGDQKVVRMMAEGEASAEDSNWVGGQATSAVSKDIKANFQIEDIAKILPHRYPFLLIDKVVEFEPGKRAVGIKQVSQLPLPHGRLDTYYMIFTCESNGSSFILTFAISHQSINQPNTDHRQ